MNVAALDRGRISDEVHLTVRYLKHELRTPINHIIGYSEMLLEDLADRTMSADHFAVETTHAIGKELLALVNATFESASSPDALATPDVVVALRASVRCSVERIQLEGLCPSSMANTPAAADVLKILGAASRLAEFARTGQIRNSEAEPSGV